jgi:hypothetical protein
MHRFIAQQISMQLRKSRALVGIEARHFGDRAKPARAM